TDAARPRPAQRHGADLSGRPTERRAATHAVIGACIFPVHWHAAGPDWLRSSSNPGRRHGQANAVALTRLSPLPVHPWTFRPRCRPHLRRSCAMPSQFTRWIVVMSLALVAAAGCARTKQEATTTTSNDSLVAANPQ